MTPDASPIPPSRIEGTLSRWNEERGYGFITPRNGGQDIFVHVTKLPRDGARPTLGEMLSFEIEIDADGRKRATAVQRPGRPRAVDAGRREPPPDRRLRSRRGLPAPVLIALLMGLGAWAYGQYSRHVAAPSEPEYAAPRPAASRALTPAPESRFSCDGRTQCSQMTSCEEAKYFLRNCPGVEMDGDGDGVPCERQFCSGW